jgi:hypothetical protein
MLNQESYLDISVVSPRRGSERVVLVFSGLTPGAISYRRRAARRKSDRLLVAAPSHENHLVMGIAYLLYSRRGLERYFL